MRITYEINQEPIPLLTYSSGFDSIQALKNTVDYAFRDFPSIPYFNRKVTIVGESEEAESIAKLFSEEIEHQTSLLDSLLTLTGTVPLHEAKFKEFYASGIGILIIKKYI